MSTLEYHVLLALASGPLHGYAIKDAVTDESSGTLAPRAGSMYRVIARMMRSFCSALLTYCSSFRD